MVGLSGVYCVLLGAFGSAAALFALLHSRRANGEHRLVAALGLVCAGLTFALAERFDGSPGSRPTPGQAGLFAQFGLLLAFGLVAQLGLRFAPVGAAPRGALPIQAGLALAALGGAAGLWSDSATAVAGFVLGASAAAQVLRGTMRSYIAGRKELGGVIFGAGVLVVTLAYDAVLEATGAATPSSGYLAPFGLFALVAGQTAKLTFEHTDVRRRLDARRRELVTRTRELQHSHHELKAAQAELSTKEQLAAVGELAAVVAHEVRNPLAILGNAVSGLRKPTIAADDRDTLLEIIESEASRLNRIVTDLLRFSRPITVQRGPIDLGELIERALSLALRKTDVTVDLQVLAEDLRVWADSNLLRQVFDNLIENALQAMDRGGTLTVRVQRGPVSSATADAERDGAVLVDIIDTGEGMDTAVRRRAKDPFFTTRPSGTGLGLAIVDRIVEAHGGQVEIESHSGQGTRVTVRLPSASSEPPGGPASNPEEGGKDADA